MRPLNSSTFLVETLKPYASGAKPGLPDELERYLLDPTDDDDAAIQERLDAVKAIWDKQREHSKYGSLVKSLTAQHDDLVLTLLDPRERARLAAKAREAAEAAQKEAAAAAQGWRDLLAEHVAKGGLTPNSRARLEWLGTQAGLDPALVTAELDRAPVAAAPEVLAADVRERIRKTLRDYARHAGEERVGLTLYHAIGLDGITSDVSEVQRLYAEGVANQGQLKIGDALTARKEVLSNVKLYLLDTDPRAYVEGLVIDVTQSLALDGARGATDGVIDPTEAEALLQSAVARGLTPELGRRVVIELARQNDASVQISAQVDYVACPSCNTPHPRPTAPEACKRCATKLFIVCPADGCGTRNDATAVRCSACGADLHRYAEAQRRLPTLPAAAEEGRVAWAAAQMQEIAGVLGPAAIPVELRDRVERRLREAETAFANAEAALGERRLFAARAALRGLVRTASDVPGPTGETPAARLREVERRLAEVDAALARARASTAAAREAALVDALRIADDCEEAASALAAIPPAPPGAPRVHLEVTGPVVEWAPSATSGARYVVRRIDARSSHVEELGTVDGARVEDRAAPSGGVVRYEVVTLRGRAQSVAVGTQAVLVAREIQSLAVADGDGEVRLSWDAVPPSARAIVRRTGEAGGAATDLVADRTGLVDRDVRNGERYAYTVSVEYAGIGGDVERTRGVTVFGQPAAPPEGIQELRIRNASGGVTIAFDRPPSGTVSILRCDEAPDVALGDAVDPADLGALGRVLQNGPDGAHDASASGVTWYLPVTVAGGTAVTGRPVRHLALPDVTNVRVEQSGAQVRVTWQWPHDVRIAKVLWRRDRQPARPDEPGVESAWVRLGEYKDNGGFTIEAPGHEPVFVAVVPGIRVDGDLIAGGVIARAARGDVRREAKARLSYAVQCSGMFKKKLDVHVDAPQGVRPPSLVLIGRPGDLLPRTRSEGDVLARLGGDAPLSSTVDLAGRARPMAVRMFLESSSSASAFQLFDPAAEDLLIR